jgi:Mrp family chromosome partitioning ATPase
VSAILKFIERSRLIDKNFETFDLHQWVVTMDTFITTTPSIDCPGSTADAGTAPSCEGCPGKSLCASEFGSQATVTDAALALRMGAIRYKIAVLSGKGGVGKSTVAVALATRLVREGARVGLLDLDICGPSVAQMLGVGGRDVLQTAYGWQPVKPDGFDSRLSVMSVAFLLASRDAPVIWRGPRKDAMIISMLRDTFWSKLDYLIIDTPPGTNDEHLRF